MKLINPDIESRRYRPQIQTVTAPTMPLLGLNQIRDHLGLVTEDDDAHLQALQEAAVGHVSQMLGFPLLTTTRRAWFDYDACLSMLRLTEPASSITSITQYSSTGTGTPVTDYFADVVSRPARISIDEYAGDDFRERNAVAVEYMTGWSAVDTPLPLVHAVLLLIGVWFAERSDVSERNTYQIPYGVAALVAPYSLSLGL